MRLNGMGIRAGLLTALIVGFAPAYAAADICVTIDEARDTFTPSERTAALLLLTRQFELEGEKVVAPGCDAQYKVAHVQLGRTITITLAGPVGQRDATALGLDDVPAVYSQMVRSLLRNVPMNAAGVIDRANVSKAQGEPPRRVYADSVVYARIGYGAIFANQTYSGPAVGIVGYRKELDSLAIDISFLNFQYKSSNRAYNFGLTPSGSSGMTGDWLKLEVLRFLSPLNDRSVYMGGGVSWSTANLESDGTSIDGSGLQGVLTAGYEIGRASALRLFVQGDVGVPFYRVRSTTYNYSGVPPYMYTVAYDVRYAPSLSFSVGLGWQRGSK